ncbi:MAG: N-methylproline demethylase, partial [Hyphomicrobiaceae bacterium]
ADLEIVTPERFFAADIGGLNHVKYAECFADHDVRITINTRLVSVAKKGNRLEATLGSDYSERTWTREIDQVVVEHGTLPLDELYQELKAQSQNLGEVDYRALINGKPQKVRRNKDGAYQLFRIGDAVSSRNIHAAIYDALRLCKDL